MKVDCQECDSDSTVLCAEDGRHYPSSGLDTFLTIDDGVPVLAVQARCRDCGWADDIRFEGEFVDPDAE